MCWPIAPKCSYMMLTLLRFGRERNRCGHCCEVRTGPAPLRIPIAFPLHGHAAVGWSTGDCRDACCSHRTPHATHHPLIHRAAHLEPGDWTAPAPELDAVAQQKRLAAYAAVDENVKDNMVCGLARAARWPQPLRVALPALRAAMVYGLACTALPGPPPRCAFACAAPLATARCAFGKECGVL